MSKMQNEKLLMILFFTIIVSFPIFLKAQNIAIVGGTIYTMKGGDLGVIENGLILIENEKIKYAGKIKTILSDYKKIDARGKIITPGLIDSGTHLGIVDVSVDNLVSDGFDIAEALSPQIRVIDGFNMHSKTIEVARKGGVTTALVYPLSRNPMSGVSAIVKLNGKFSEKIFLKKEFAIHINLGEAPKRTFKKKKEGPMSRMGTISMIRNAFISAINYKNKLKNLKKKGLNNDKINLKDEILMKAIDGKIPVIIHCHRKDDILVSLNLKKEFGFKMILANATEAYNVIDELKKEGLSVIFGPVRTDPSSFETLGAMLKTAGILNKAGILLSIMTDEIYNVRNLPLEVGFASAYGLDEVSALKAITIDAAKIFDIDHRIGSIEEGKDADIVIWSGNPLKVRSVPEIVIIDGEIFNGLGKRE